MTPNEKIEAALERIIHESPYNGPIVAQAYKDLLAGAKLFGVPSHNYHVFLSLIEEQALDSGPKVLAELAYETENIARVSALVDDQARIYKVEVFGTLGQRIRTLASVLQLRVEALEKQLSGVIDRKLTAPELRVHELGAACWCDPILDGNITKHR